jgi:hypothetical protein
MMNLKKMKTFLASLLLLFIIGPIGSIIAFFPNTKDPSVSVLIIVWVLALMIASGRFLNDFRPGPMATFLMLFNFANLFLLSAIRFLGAILSGWVWLVLLLCAYLLAWNLPLISPRLTSFINIRLSDLKTPLGKNCLIVTICLIGIMGLTNELLVFSSNTLLSPSISTMRFLGILSTFLAIVCGQSFSYQFWMKWGNRIKSRLNRAGKSF